MPRNLLLTLALAVATSGCSAAHVGPGSRVRISAPEVSRDRLAGTVEALHDDTLDLKLEDGQVIQPVPLASIERLELSRGFVRGNGAFMGAGGLIGLGIGVAVAASALSDECTEPSLVSCDVRYFALFAIPAYLGLGLFAGWVVSAPFFEFENWKEVSPNRLRVGIAPHRAGHVAFVASVAF